MSYEQEQDKQKYLWAEFADISDEEKSFID